ncbi:TPA: isochorismate synthase [Stenotrophomonas maltophilia]
MRQRLPRRCRSCVRPSRTCTRWCWRAACWRAPARRCRRTCCWHAWARIRRWRPTRCRCRWSWARRRRGWWGATPELLLRKRGAELLSHPLAGSARRSADAAEDERAAQALLASTKDHDEHRHVVDAIVEGLAPYCSHIDAQPRPMLHATASMWHLGTRIHATLKDPQTSAAELLAQLHPTPAVCGTPRLAALQRIRELEPVPRGFYAGAVGWLDAQGDGDWYVAIRCARLQGTQLRLYAGAGIVAESEPEAEVAETAAKFAALLNALGVHESAPAIEPAA